MFSLPKAVNAVVTEQKMTGRPLTVLLAGHNGSGKSTMWYERGLADTLQIPLVNADRMMLSILPETCPGKPLPAWASKLRDHDQNWMRVAQQGVQAFVAFAMGVQAPFAMETVFSHWHPLSSGRIESKIDLIRQMQRSGYFVLLFFVGLADVNLSVARVSTRAQSGGHDVALKKLHERFPRTQTAIKHAVSVANAAILVDNSRTLEDAFTVCRVQLGDREIYDCRKDVGKPAQAILQWLGVVSPS